MNIAQGIFSLNCKKCKVRHEFYADNIEFEIISKNEEQLGIENTYVWKHSFNCEHCGNKINICYGVWEYPTGVYNSQQVEIKGGEKLKQFEYDFRENLKPYYLT